LPRWCGPPSTWGHTLGLRVVAEGVEDADPLLLLKDMGCDEVQGYYISRLVEPDALARWARTLRLGAEETQPLAA
jgi:EAL domain-containing protein (putative c-di-GMP-specific phosphodiesterase class I)